MKTIELVGLPSATTKIARELEAHGARVSVRDSTKPHEVARPLADVDLVVLLGTNGLGSAVREAARARGINCVALPYNWSRARPILEAKGVLSMGHRPLEKLAPTTKEIRCACGRLSVGHGLVPLPDGSVHGEKQCQALRAPAPEPPTAAEQSSDPGPGEEWKREDKIAWARAEGLRDRDATPTEVARRTREHFGVGLDSHTIIKAVRSARGEEGPKWNRGSTGDVQARRREAARIFEEDPTRKLAEVSAMVKARFGTGVSGAILSGIRDRVLRRVEREQKPIVPPPPKAESFSPSLRAAIESVKSAGAAEGLRRIALDFRDDGTVAVEWERHVVRSGKATL